ncbi:hypothetical protein SAMN05428942_2120 [Streptomyces sp. 2112.2]|uniref:hypothetical protein n=1 Tax=Streptomyces sp. 2112.2 TaxID=1881024 RepID=UPI000897ECDF|nr:hypothetical protein [Streptomyces sp. 2112.2]SED60697.1 hypothetical protein SAMN05428942_2120 [Streptomyces sp. 2112.2]
MTGLLAVFVLLGWIAGGIFLTAFVSTLLDEEPLLRLAAQLRPVAVALYLAVVIVFWPAALIARAVAALANRERP